MKIALQHYIHSNNPSNNNNNNDVNTNISNPIICHSSGNSLNPHCVSCIKCVHINRTHTWKQCMSSVCTMVCLMHVCSVKCARLLMAIVLLCVLCFLMLVVVFIIVSLNDVSKSCMTVVLSLSTIRCNNTVLWSMPVQMAKPFPLFCDTCDSFSLLWILLLCIRSDKRHATSLVRSVLQSLTMTIS